MNIAQIFINVSKFLPNAVMVKALSIYPLPYDGFFEVYVECKNGKRYRALADTENVISDFSEFDLGVKNGAK